LFIVTKLPMAAMQPGRVERFFEMSRKNLGLDYIDLYLIHTPVGLEIDDNSPQTIFIKMDKEGKVATVFDDCL